MKSLLVLLLLLAPLASQAAVMDCATDLVKVSQPDEFGEFNNHAKLKQGDFELITVRYKYKKFLHQLNTPENVELFGGKIYVPDIIHRMAQPESSTISDFFTSWVILYKNEPVGFILLAKQYNFYAGAPEQIVDEMDAAILKGNRTFLRVGYVIDSKFRHQGLAATALKMVLDHGFNTLHAKYIYGKTLPENIASQNTLLRNGFEPAKTSDALHSWFRLDKATVYFLPPGAS